MAEVRARAHMYILDEEDNVFNRKRVTREREGVSYKRSTKEHLEGEKSKRKEEKAPHEAKQNKQALYPPRETYERQKPWQQQ